MSPGGESATSSMIYERLRGLIASGYLGQGERLPTVRQTAADFGVAPGTAARAFRQLEQEGLVETRKGGGTRVADSASPLPGLVVAKMRELVQLADSLNITVDDLQSALLAIWPATR
ncbi:GntR family transcriptional regulator [Microbacterium sp. SORGH_AS_0421]|uniref:GntR family transcriptional regulator n=1 Tax=Microbacterium sp. SORGH_AS_0421 TaxID=3041768 RepID=UPI0027937289|nr:GntR family transcriptional regulator [Microbacterium sp. SORGH_AS_0421]MDQ1175419.1 GntR family transcriptional regulator [Microbacterium sp. SORGH_AS_0421]